MSTSLLLAEAFSGVFVVEILMGLLLLFFGRKLFWFFVAAVGFLLGLQFAADVISNIQPWLIWLIAIGFGLIGAIFAVLLQKAAIILAGGIAAGLFAMRLVVEFGMAAPIPLIAFFVVGVIAAIVTGMLFEWALIFLSALTGAWLVVDAWAISTNIRFIALVVLLVLGVLVQSYFTSRTSPAPE